MASITFKNIQKTYPGGVQAVRDFDLEVADGEFVVLVGPSGCGKSTTLRMIAGLEEVTAGELYLGERLVNKVPPKDRDIAMVFQNYALYPHMTVFDNMAFGLKMRKVPGKIIRRKVEEAAKILDLGELLDRKPKALSGGQRQRVALGRAIVRAPSVFLLDEPLSNLDARLRTQMRSEITRLHKRLGTTFIYVTHDQTEAMTMGDRLVVMKDGFIQQVDTPRNLYDHPCNLFVAGFIGSPQMNQFPAEPEEENGVFVLRFSGGTLPLPPDRFPEELLRPYLGREVVAGLRPEALSRGVGAALDATVDLCELMGAQVYLHTLCGETRLAATLPTADAAQPGETVRLAVDSNKLYLFDQDSGVTIGRT